MKKKRRSPKPIAPTVSESSLSFQEFGLDPSKHAEFKQAMLEAARTAVDAFPAQLEAVKEVLRRVSPAQALAAFTCYAAQASLTKTGEQEKAIPDIEQHHGEFLQAIVLSIPTAEWGEHSITPKDMGDLFKAVPELTRTFNLRSILDSQEFGDDEAAWTIRFLQERIRTHTQIVRNWGYFGQVVALSRELYAPLDSKLRSHHKFGGTDLIDALAAVVSEFERRLLAHWNLLARVIRSGKTVRRLVELYYKHVPFLEGTAEEFLRHVPYKMTRDQMLGVILRHYDLRLAQVALFSPKDVAELCGLTEEVVVAVMRAIAYAPGALESARPDFLFLENPVWDRPAIDFAEEFLIPIPQMAFSHIHRLLHRIASEAGLSESLSDRRSEFLEQRVEAVFRRALPDANVRPAAKWIQDGVQYEHDVLVIVDHVVVIAEAKSHRLTPEGLRGAPDRLKRHISDMVLGPSVQSARLEALIECARAGDPIADTTLATLGINAFKADLVIRLSVTLDDISVLSSSERDFKKIGWVPEDHSLAPSMLIADLETIADILNNELLFLHYLSERSHLQKSQQLLGDELDFLGLYLSSGFHLPDFNKDNWDFNVSGLSKALDRYYIGREAGLKIAKPTAALGHYFRAVIERLEMTKPPGWTLAGIQLLSAASAPQQRSIEHNLAKLRKVVKQTYRDPKHHCTLLVKPLQERKSTVMFYLFPQELRSDYRETLPLLVSQAMADHGIGSLVAFARCIDNWSRPYETVLLTKRAS